MKSKIKPLPNCKEVKSFIYPDLTQPHAKDKRIEELEAACRMAINTIDNAPNNLVDFITDRLKTVKALKKALAGKGE